VFAAAQAISALRDVTANVASHVRLASRAASHGARFVVFPELSLTSYDLGLTVTDALASDDGRLDPLRQASAALGITIVAGAPLAAPNGLQIGALIIRPDGTCATHAKQYLHAGEDVAFSPGAGGAPLAIDESVVGLAICADFTHPEHARVAAAHGALVYAAGALISENGYAADTAFLRRYATDHHMLVLLANYGAEAGGWVSAGRSAAWLPGGALLAEAPPRGEAVVVARRVDGSWAGCVVPGDRG
jgi:predicted amidohydrolase